MAPHVTNDKTKEYIADYNNISNSSENSLVIPLLSEYQRSASSTIPMSPFVNKKSAGANHRMGYPGCCTFPCCPAPFCYRKSKCFLFLVALGVISFLSVALLYNWECTPIMKNCSIDLSPNSNTKRLPLLTTNITEERSAKSEMEKKSLSPNVYYGSSNDNLMQQLIQLNQHTGKHLVDSSSVSMDNLISYASIQQNDDVQFKIDQNDVMVFLHVQKTGGTTFERHLVRDIDLEAPCTCRKKKRRKKLYFDEYGHRKKKWFAGGCECFRPSSNSNVAHTKSTWLFSRYNTGWKCGLHADWTELTECVDSYLDTEEGVTNRRYFYMAFLRDPITRYISEWKHVNRGATWKDSKFMCNGKAASKSEVAPCYDEEATWEGVSLLDFMGCKNNLAINRQTRMMADLRLVNCYNTTNMSKHERETTLLASAKTNLERLAFFGITSEQAKSQYLFEDTFNLKFKVPFEAQNQHSKSDISYLDEDTLNKIKELNSLDVELFHYAQEMMQKRFDAVKSDDVNFDSNYHSLSQTKVENHSTKN